MLNLKREVSQERAGSPMTRSPDYGNNMSDRLTHIVLGLVCSSKIVSSKATTCASAITAQVDALIHVAK
jgi:hypothetical protein